MSCKGECECRAEIRNDIVSRVLASNPTPVEEAVMFFLGDISNSLYELAQTTRPKAKDPACPGCGRYSGHGPGCEFSR